MAGHGNHGTAHVMSIPGLLGTFMGLIVLTGLTVGVHYGIDLGSKGNLIVAMVIATMKAGLVLAFFMHLIFDKRYNFMIFATSVLGVVLFIAISFTDVSENLPDQLKRQADVAAAAKK
jgi:cytochrome c oxidase subunit 4